MTRFLSMLAILFVGTQLNAQVTYGFKAGVVVSNWRGNATDVLNSMVEVSNNNIRQQAYKSIYAGGFVNIPVTERWSVEPGLNYARMGTTLRGDLNVKILDILGANAKASAVTHVIELPVLVKVEVADGLKLFLGPQAAWNTRSQLQVRAGLLGINLLNQKIGLDNFMEPFNFSAAGGVQYQTKGGLAIEAGYYHGLTSLIRNGNAEVYSKSFRVGLSYPLNFSRDAY